MSKYLVFERAAVEGRKTPIVSVRSRSTGDKLGEIRWFGRWRQFCLFPSPGTVFNNGCMRDIINHITGLHRERALRRVEEEAVRPAGVKSPKGVTLHG